MQKGIDLSFQTMESTTEDLHLKKCRFWNKKTTILWRWVCRWENL